MGKPLVLENIQSQRYSLDINEKLENGHKVAYLIIQDRVAKDRYAKFSGSTALATYRGLKGLFRSKGVGLYDNECRKFISEQRPEAKIEAPAAAPASNDIWVVECPANLNEIEYDRLKGSVESGWPAHLPKPILLAPGIVIRKMNIN